MSFRASVNLCPSLHAAFAITQSTYSGPGSDHRGVKLLRIADKHETRAVKARNRQQGVGLCHLAAFVEHDNRKALLVKAGKRGGCASDAHNAR